jgi:hypothetical protein
MATTDVMRLRSAGEVPKARFDYRGKHRYLITLDPAPGRTEFADKPSILKVLSVLREQSWEHKFDVIAYSFAPERLVMLVRGRDDASYMKGFLAAFRAAADVALGSPLWKRTYRERVLRKKEDLRDIVRDIFMAPVRDGRAAHPAAYEFQGSFVDKIVMFFPPDPHTTRTRGSVGHRRPSGNARVPRPTRRDTPRR